ncbi:MAG: hypothetical protein O6945_05085, partial [Gammaproteobacteria bacterium]|nr:hypothetical protein [Gammaproteobacteria bacterium]
KKVELDYIKANIHRLNAMPVDMVFHMGKLGAILIAEGAVNFASWVRAMKRALGSKDFGKVESDLEEIYALSQDQRHQDRAVQGEQDVTQVLTAVEAMSEIDEALTHKMVYELVRGYILQGIVGENEVMAKAHADLEPLFPNLSERDVRRLFSQYGKAIFPSQQFDKKRARELRNLIRIQESIDRLTEGKAAKRTGLQRDKDTPEIREKTRALRIWQRRYDRNHPVPSRDKLANIDQTRITRLTNRLADLEKELRTGEKPGKPETVPDSPEVIKLKGKINAIKERLAEIEAAKNPPLTEDQRYNQLRGKQFKRELREVERRLREKDYAKQTRKTPPELSDENLQLQSELVEAKVALNEKIMVWERAQLDAFGKGVDFLYEAISISRATITSVDLSAVLRQGGFITMANPSLIRRTYGAMISALKSKANQIAVFEEIQNRENFRLYKIAKIHLNAPGATDPGKVDEVYQGRLQEHVPIVAASGRAYLAFLNRLRVDAFDKILASFETKGQVLTTEEIRALGRFINMTTGRGSVGVAGGKLGSIIFFAPRWVLSRFQLALFVPLWPQRNYLGGGKMVNPVSLRMKKEFFYQYARAWGGYMIMWNMLAIAFGAGSGDEDDPRLERDMRSSDFGKLKVGNTRLDVTAGMSNAMVFMGRTVTGEMKTLSGEIKALDSDLYGATSWDDVGWRYLRSKLAPLWSSLINIRTGTNVVGETYEDRGEFLREGLGITPKIAENKLIIEGLSMTVPLALRDFYEALLEHGYPPAIALQLVAIHGVSMNTFEPTRGGGIGKLGTLDD